MAHQRIAVFERLIQSPVKTVLAGYRLIAPQKEIGSLCAKTIARGYLIRCPEHKVAINR
jgi:hypothetical protein